MSATGCCNNVIPFHEIGLSLRSLGDNRYFSFADAGLIEQYNSDFVTLREGRSR